MLQVSLEARASASAEGPTCAAAGLLDLCWDADAKRECPTTCGLGTLGPSLLQRGASIAATDRSRIFDKVLQGKSSINSDRVDWQAKKLQADIAAAEAAVAEHPRDGEPPKPLALAPGPPRVAFLFLLKDRPDNEHVWDEFFKRAPQGNYSIFVHRTTAPGQDRLPPPLAKWGAQEVPRVNTEWCSFIGAEVALVRAALKDPSSTQLVLVSQSTVPLKSFPYIYSQLVLKSQTTSKVCFAGPADSNSAIMEGGMCEMRSQCIYRDFYRQHDKRILKHHQWVIFARRHAETFVARAGAGLRRFSKVWAKVAPDVRNEGCSDETVPVTALLQDLEDRGESTGDPWRDLKQMGVEQACPTFVSWRHCFRGSELFLEESVSFSTLKKLVSVVMSGQNDEMWEMANQVNGFPRFFDTVSKEYLSKLVHEGFMFGRKFLPNATVAYPDGTHHNLASVLPALWEQVEESKAEKKLWRQLETGGLAGGQQQN